MIVKSSLFTRMCITFVWINEECRPGDNENWQLILINNRDEFYSRPTLPARWNDGVEPWFAIGLKIKP
uniref:Uncharacterized protein n=1 Tax=Romanomermis culicivorax TaxID=13658 RepID=A0A915L6S0_ROMCU